MEFTKYETSKYIRTFCSDLSKKKKIDENIVACRITNLLSTDVDSLLECEKAELADLQHKLDNLYKHKAEGAFIRLRSEWIEEGIGSHITLQPKTGCPLKLSRVEPGQYLDAEA